MRSDATHRAAANGVARQPLVSVCIPTYRRVDLLRIALQSVIVQAYDAVEIVVGDDSPDDAAEMLIESLRPTTAFPIRYSRNVPKLGQNGNVDRLFHRATGSYLILLHDDDVLLAGAISALVAPVLANAGVRVVFGKQNLIDAVGTVLSEPTRKINTYFRRDRPSGPIESALEAGLMQQMPNDSYLIETALARTVGYRSEAQIGVRVDVDFGIRVGELLLPGQMWFVDTFVASYRHSDESISSSTRSRRSDHPTGSVALYRSVAALSVPAGSEHARQFLLRTFIDSMVKGFALRGDRFTALKLFASSAYGWRKRLSRKGVYHLALVLLPALDRVRRY